MRTAIPGTMPLSRGYEACARAVLAAAANERVIVFIEGENIRFVATQTRSALRMERYLPIVGVFDSCAVLADVAETIKVTCDDEETKRRHALAARTKMKKKKELIA